MRDIGVTGVQTCALPISRWMVARETLGPLAMAMAIFLLLVELMHWRQHWAACYPRSEERRVWKECRSRWSSLYYINKYHHDIYTLIIYLIPPHITRPPVV